MIHYSGYDPTYNQYIWMHEDRKTLYFTEQDEKLCIAYFYRYNISTEQYKPIGATVYNPQLYSDNDRPVELRKYFEQHLNSIIHQ